MSNKPTVYMIPGLAATKLIYRNTVLPEGYERVYLEWYDPSPGDTLDSYAKRFAEQIDTSKPFVLVGSSLGGIMSGAMSKYVSPEKIILVSSIESIEELPWYLKMFKYFPVYWLIPYFILKFFARYARLVLSNSTKEDAEMVRIMFQQNTGKFFRWALHAVLNWEQTGHNDKVVRIHGTNDPLFRMKYLKKDGYWVNGGDHFMVVTRGKEISGYIAEILATL